MPPAVFSWDSSRSTTTLSPRGWSVTLVCDFGFDLVAVAMCVPPGKMRVVDDLSGGLCSVGCEQTRGRGRPGSLTAVEPLIGAQNQPVGKGSAKASCAPKAAAALSCVPAESCGE